MCSTANARSSSALRAKWTICSRLWSSIKQKKYLVPLSDVHNDEITNLLDSKKLIHKEVVMYRTVSNDFKSDEKFDYDMLIFFSPSGIQALLKNFPDFEQKEIAIGTFGPATAQAAKDAGLRLDMELPLRNTRPSRPHWTFRKEAQLLMLIK